MTTLVPAPVEPSVKPAFSVPSMADIGAVRGSNGLTVVSTFSGCGGSCLGFEAAGYEVLWASEFVDEARQTYEANHPGVTVDRRDIRDVTAADVLDEIGLGAGELDVLEGSPPCASFSTAGRRHESWGVTKKYSDTAQRSDDLFWEFARLVGGVQPKVFVAENVAGLTVGVSKGYFKRILTELRRQGYRVEARILDAQWLGVPQARRRVIFLGVREDLDVPHVWPKPLPYRYSISEALGWNVPGYRHVLVPDDPETGTSLLLADTAIGREWDQLRLGTSSKRYFLLVRPSVDAPCPTITQSTGSIGAAGVTHPTQRRKFNLVEARRLCSFPDDFVLTGTYHQRWERLGRAVPPLMMRAVATSVASMLNGREDGL